MHGCGAQIESYTFDFNTTQATYTPIGSTCGSDFDNVGNRRFLEHLSQKGESELYDVYRPYYSIPIMVDGEWSGDLSFGYTSYDNFWRAFTATFQACSMEGWTGIMYQTMDAWNIPFSVIIFVVLVLIGGNIVLNLVLAVVSSSLDKLEEDEEEEEEEEEVEEEEGEEVSGSESRS